MVVFRSGIRILLRPAYPQGPQNLSVTGWLS